MSGKFGLAIIREIAVAHGGRASAGDAGPGRGAEFVITLPLLAAGRDAEA